MAENISRHECSLPTALPWKAIHAEPTFKLGTMDNIATYCRQPADWLMDMCLPGQSCSGLTSSICRSCTTAGAKMMMIVIISIIIIIIVVVVIIIFHGSQHHALHGRAGC